MRVLSVVHDPAHTGGGGLFEKVVAERGDTLDRWVVADGEAVPGDPSRWDAVMVFGGAMHPDQDAEHPWLGGEVAFIAEALSQGVPTIGVCLGAQLVARAVGGRSVRAAAPEVGWHEVELTAAGRDDPVLSSLPPRFEAFQWHHYTWELPAATELARGGGLTQAYRLGETSWGVQFHPEVTAGQIERWIADDPEDVADADALRAATRSRIGTWNRAGRDLCTTFLREAAKAT